MLTADQLRNAWYTVTRPEFDGPIRIHTGFDRRTAIEVCRGLLEKNEYCVVGYGFQRSLIGDE